MLNQPDNYKMLNTAVLQQARVQVITVLQLQNWGMFG
jgi:hypothetical protein